MVLIVVTIPANSNIVESIIKLLMNTMVKIQCCLCFSQKSWSLFLMAEVIDEIADVKLIVT
jgi:hypothetical protein